MARRKKRWKVYLHTVPKEISGCDQDKHYVGLTCKADPEKRWEHGFGYRANTHFYRAIEKYGWNNIKHEILADNLSKIEAEDMERFFIAMYRSNESGHGYNKTLGGEGSLGHKQSKEARLKRSERFKGENNPYYGKKHSDETRKKMSENHYDCLGKKNPRSKRVHQFDFNYDYIRSFDTVVEASNNIGICDMGIRRAIWDKGTAGGFLWVFDDNVVKTDSGYEMKNKFPIPTKNRKEIFQFDLEGKFIDKYVSSNEAEKKIKENHNLTIRREGIFGASQRKGTSANYIWRFREDVEETEDGSYILKERKAV